VANKEIRLSDLINQSESIHLKAFVRNNRKPNGPSVNAIVMKWLDANPQVLKRFETHEVFKSYGAYMLEFYLDLK
jgi:hypothetical protein